MATVRKGSQAVLLVVDVQMGVMRSAWDSARIIHNIGTVVEKARSQHIPVIWVQHTDDELVQDSPDWQIVPELVPAAGEMRISKNYNSAFEQTPLEETLAGLGAVHIVLTGAATNWCIRATAYAAIERGYDLTLISDAHTTEAIRCKDGTNIAAQNLIHDLNMAMAWLSYPGRTNNAVSAKDIVFEPSGSVRQGNLL